MAERLDEQKLAVLRRWGEGLTRDGRDEVRAAGRALVLLSDEVERLRVDRIHAREESQAAVLESAPAESEEKNPPDWPRASDQPQVGKALRDRIVAFRLSKPG